MGSITKEQVQSVAMHTGLKPRYMTESTLQAALAMIRAKNERNEQLRLLNIAEREAEEAYADAVRALRPLQLVDRELVADIGEAVEKLRSGEPWGTHHSSAVHPGSRVRLSTEGRRLNVHADAPKLPRTGGSAWGYTEADVEEILDAVRATGAVVVSHWVHEDGIGVVVGA